MPQPKNERTKQIIIEDEAQDPPVEAKHFELHIGPAGSPAINEQNKAGKINVRPKQQTKLSGHRTNVGGTRIGVRIWNFMEWIAMSALIFLLFFFIINFQSYSELLKLKVSKLTGTFKLDPYINEIISPDNDPVDQDLLPLDKNTVAVKQQIPALDLGIAPPDDRVIIPRINKNVPVVGVSTENLIRKDWGALEKDIQQALRDGVVHYPGTSQPGQRGNVVITGHSSYFPWDPGRFKDVFALLHDVVVGDEILVYHDQKAFKYLVSEKKVVMPDEINVLTQQGDEKLTLITCTPVGTNLKRLIIIAKPVS